MNITREGVKEAFEIVDGVVIQPGTYDHEEAMLQFLGNRSAPLNFSMLAIIGGRFGGDRINLTPTLRYRIGEKFSSELAYIINDFDLPVPGGDFTANLATTALELFVQPASVVAAARTVQRAVGHGVDQPAFFMAAIGQFGPVPRLQRNRRARFRRPTTRPRVHHQVQPDIFDVLN